jgi:hypothetical protein
MWLAWLLLGAGALTIVALAARVRQLEFAATVRYPPIYSVYKFELLLTDQLADALALTPEQRKTLAANPVRPTGFVLERWGQFDRWRIRFTCNGQSEEVTADVYPYPDLEWEFSPHLTLWITYFGERLGSDSLCWEWSAITDPPQLRLYAAGGRFGGNFLPHRIDPRPESTLLALPFPLDEYEGAYKEFRVLNESSPDREVYECERNGVRWRLEHRDLRRQLTARVLRTAPLRKNPSKVKGIRLKLRGFRPDSAVEGRRLCPLFY